MEKQEQFILIGNFLILVLIYNDSFQVSGEY